MKSLTPHHVRQDVEYPTKRKLLTKVGETKPKIPKVLYMCQIHHLMTVVKGRPSGETLISLLDHLAPRKVPFVPGRRQSKTEIAQRVGQRTLRTQKKNVPKEKEGTLIYFSHSLFCLGTKVPDETFQSCTIKRDERLKSCLNISYLPDIISRIYSFTWDLDLSDSKLSEDGE